MQSVLGEEMSRLGQEELVKHQGYGPVRMSVFVCQKVCVFYMSLCLCVLKPIDIQYIHAFRPHCIVLCASVFR